MKKSTSINEWIPKDIKDMIALELLWPRVVQIFHGLTGEEITMVKMIYMDTTQKEEEMVDELQCRLERTQRTLDQGEQDNDFLRPWSGTRRTTMAFVF